MTAAPRIERKVIVEGVARLNEGKPDDPLHPLTVRVGVNTGEAAVTLASGVQQGENVAGDVVNTASRLQTALPLGSAIVGETTYRATRSVFEYEAMDPITVKGKARPLSVWRVAAAQGQLGVAVDRDYSTPFVGRRTELALLERALRRATEHSTTQLVTVVAEPGAGRSRLIAQFRAELEAGRAGPSPMRRRTGCRKPRRCWRSSERSRSWRRSTPASRQARPPSFGV
jgi:hypothetical protein